MKSFLFSGVLALSLAASGAMAQDTDNRVGANTDWSVFEEASKGECWAVSAPKESTITKDGRLVSANRGTILMFVSFWKGEAGAGQVSQDHRRDEAWRQGGGCGLLVARQADGGRVLAAGLYRFCGWCAGTLQIRPTAPVMRRPCPMGRGLVCVLGRDKPRGLGYSCRLVQRMHA